jgi:hypothetical protein
MSLRRFCALFFFVLISCAGWAQFQSVPIQWAPTALDPQEPVTIVPRALTDPQERAAVLAMLDRARQNYTLQSPHAPAFTIHATLNSSGSSQFEGRGEMEQTWTPRADRWTASIGTNQTLRIGFAGRMWSDNPEAPVPMRVQMARAALLWPVYTPRPRVLLRYAEVNYNGHALDCVLIAAGMEKLDQTRHWVEEEYCMDQKSGELVVWSPAPGFYALYDYQDALPFHGHNVARQVSIYEAGNLTMQIHVDSLVDAEGVSAESLRPGKEILAKGPSFALALPQRYPIRLPLSQKEPNSQNGGAVLIRPVIVHATLDRNGQVIEAEALQNSDPELAARAIETVRNAKSEGSRGQREVFVNVEFFTHAPAQQASIGK